MDDNGAFSEQVEVTIDVIAAGELPFEYEDHFTVEKDQTLTVAAPGLLINDFNPNADNIIVSNYFSPANGTLTSIVTNGSFIYVPATGFTGTDSFQYIVQDENGNFSTAVTVFIDVVESFNRIPNGGEDFYSTEAETPLVIAAPGLLFNDSDPEGDDIIVSNYFAPPNGTLTSIVTNGSFTYVPGPGFTGDDSFQYIIRDENGNFSDYITVHISVREPDNRKPVGITDNYAVVEGTTLTIAAPGLLSNDTDPDGDGIIVSNYFAPPHGTLTSIVTNGSFIYVPDAGYTGADSFQYIVRDDNGSFSDPVTVTLQVFGINQLPVADAADVTAECEGPAGTALVLDGSSTTVPEDGILQFTWYENGSIIAGPSSTPTAEVVLPTGVHIITLMVEDECGNTSSDDATVTIEDTTGPLVEADFLETNHPKEFEISCSAKDLCTEIVSSLSVIKIPELVNPSVTLKNQKKYSLDIKRKKNTVSVKAPDAASFWASVLANGGVTVSNGQVIRAKGDKNKYKFSFDSGGNLVSVEGDIVTLRCTATDGNGNTSMDEATIPPSMLKSADAEIANSDGEEFNGLFRNYPNPFAQETTIEFRLEKPSFVNVTIYDMAGRKVEELASKQMPAGIHEIVWNAKQNKTGVYYYRIEYDGDTFSNKMILQR